jgi:hypothetical protein
MDTESFMGQYECSVCGHDVSGGANYCEKCGAKLKWPEQMTPAPDEEHNAERPYAVQQQQFVFRRQPYYDEETQKRAADIFKKVAIGLLIFVVLLALMVFGLIFGTC